MSIPFKCSHLIVSEPVSAASVPNNSLFEDASNGNLWSIKDEGGVTQAINTATGTNPMLKTMQSDDLFDAFAPLIKLANGRVIKADSNNPLSESFCGYAMVASTMVGQSVLVTCPGPNIAGAITGLGFTPGDIIFINENGGYTNDPSTFTGNNDTFIKVGLADCSGGAVASPIATDLIATYEFVAGV